MKHWLNDTDTEEPKYLDQNLSQCHLFYNKSPKMDQPGMELEPPQWEAGI